MERTGPVPGMNNVHFDLHTALTAWQWGPFSVLVGVTLFAIAYWYLAADWRLAARGRKWPWYRTLPFLLGLAAVEVALGSPVATFTGSYFQAHVVQHLLLMAIAPPLLALGAPSTLLLQTASRTTKTRWLSVLHSRPFAAATHPVPVWFFYFGAMFAFFLSPLVNYAMEHMALMDLINVVFLLGGTFYWWPVVGLDPIVHWRMGYGARILNLGLGIPFESFLGIALMSDRAPVASMYTAESTHSGGALLWAAAELVTIAGLVPVVWQWMRADERAGARADARARQAQARPAAPALAGGRAQRALGGAEGAVTTRRADPVPVTVTDHFKPLLQPGNSSWEAMWKAKAGFVPSSSRRPRPADAKPSAPPPAPAGS